MIAAVRLGLARNFLVGVQATGVCKSLHLFHYSLKTHGESVTLPLTEGLS